MSAGAAVALGLARALPAAWVAPPLGHVSWPARVMVAGALTAVAWPILNTAQITEGAFFTEALAGLALGLVASVPFRAAEAAGALISRTATRRERPLGDAFGLFTLALFAAVGGPLQMALAWGQSYLVLAPGAALDAGRVGVEAGAQLIATAIALALPALSALLLAELIGGLIARAQPLAPGGAALRPAVALVAVAAGVAGLVVLLAGASLGSLGPALEAAARRLTLP
jgi:type III secretory pathway component EscT